MPFFGRTGFYRLNCSKSGEVYFMKNLPFCIPETIQTPQNYFGQHRVTHKATKIRVIFQENQPFSHLKRCFSICKAENLTNLNENQPFRHLRCLKISYLGKSYFSLCTPLVPLCCGRGVRRENRFQRSCHLCRWSKALWSRHEVRIYLIHGHSRYGLVRTDVRGVPFIPRPVIDCFK